MSSPLKFILPILFLTAFFTLVFPSRIKAVYVEGHELSEQAAAKYKAFKQEVIDACKLEGLQCNIEITSTLTGKHKSRCHKRGNKKSGTCADFRITVNGEKLSKPPKGPTQKKALNIVIDTAKKSKNIVSCLNEYKVRTKYSTGPHMHCNF